MLDRRFLASARASHEWAGTSVYDEPSIAPECQPIACDQLCEAVGCFGIHRAGAMLVRRRCAHRRLSGRFRSRPRMTRAWGSQGCVTARTSTAVGFTCCTRQGRRLEQGPRSRACGSAPTSGDDGLRFGIGRNVDRDVILRSRIVDRVMCGGDGFSDVPFVGDLWTFDAVTGQSALDRG